MAKLIPCPLCNSPKYSKMFNLNEDRVIVKCKTCSMVYSNPMPDKEEIRALYDSEYFFHEGKMDYGYKNYLELEHLFHIMYRIWWQRLSPYLNNNTKQKKVLEIGCAAGYFLDIAKESGYEVYGIEPTPLGEHTKKKYGENIYISTFEDTEFQNSSFDLIVFFDVLEHIDNPIAFFNKIVPYLRPNGVIALSIPNIDNIFCKVFGKRWFQFKIDHLNYFSRKTIRKLVSRYDLDIIEITNCIKVTTLNFILDRLKDYYKIQLPIQIQRNLENWGIFKSPFRYPLSGELFISMKKNWTDPL